MLWAPVQSWERRLCTSWTSHVVTIQSYRRAGSRSIAFLDLCVRLGAWSGQMTLDGHRPGRVF